jgi:hypothetical protein
MKRPRFSVYISGSRDHVLDIRYLAKAIDRNGHDAPIAWWNDDATPSETMAVEKLDAIAGADVFIWYVHNHAPDCEASAELGAAIAARRAGDRPHIIVAGHHTANVSFAEAANERCDSGLEVLDRIETLATHKGRTR